MKSSIIKRMLTGVLAAALVMAPAMSVAAAPTSEVASGSTVADEAVATSTSDSTSSTVAAVAVPASSTVAGVKTTTKGTYLAKSVNGAAITTGASTISSSYGLKSGETPYTKISDLDPKKSHLAKAAIDQAAASQGAEVGPMINQKKKKMAGGKYSLLPSDGAEIRVSFGIPKNFAQANKTFAVVCVRAGGAVSILVDVDDNPNTVTFDTTGGAGAYAIIKY